MTEMTTGGADERSGGSARAGLCEIAKRTQAQVVAAVTEMTSDGANERSGGSAQAVDAKMTERTAMTQGRHSTP